MTKQVLTASRDIKKGELMTNVITWTEGYFHYFDKTGTAYSSPHARKALTPEQKKAREQEALRLSAEVQKRKEERKLKRELRQKAQAEAKEVRKKMKQLQIEKEIAKLEGKKAKL